MTVYHYSGLLLSARDYNIIASGLLLSALVVYHCSGLLLSARDSRNIWIPVLCSIAYTFSFSDRVRCARFSMRREGMNALGDIMN